MLVLGSKNVSKLMLGQRIVSKAFLGQKLVWPNIQPLPYDAEVEWIESFGEQYIDTGIVLGPNIHTEIEFMVVDFDTLCRPFGVRQGRTSYQVGTEDASDEAGGSCYASWSVYTYTNSQGSDQRVHLNDGKWHSATLDSTSGTLSAYLEIDGLGKQYRTAAGGGGLTWKMYAFGVNAPFAHNLTRCKMRKLKIVDTSTGNALRDYVFVRFTNEQNQCEAALYDKVSQQLFRNQGTGRLVAGPDVIPTAYDAEVRYIQSTGTQWLDLGTTFSSDVGLEIRAAFTAKTTDIYPVLVGGLSDTDWIGSYFALYEDSGYVTLEDTTAGAEVSQGDVNGAKFTAKMNLDDSGVFMLDIDGYSPTQSSGHDVPVSSNICLFCATLPNNNVVNLAQAKVYAMKITKGTEVVRYLIPVRFTNNQGQTEGAMFDLVTRQLHRNQGTGNFIVSADKYTPYDARVLYVETDGLGAYIDTGVIPVFVDAGSGSSVVYLTAKYVSVLPVSQTANNATNLCGARSGTGITSGTHFCVLRGQNLGKYRFFDPNAVNASDQPQLDFNIHDFVLGNGMIQFDGVSIEAETYTYQDSNPTTSFCLGSSGVDSLRPTSNPQRFYSNARFYSCKIYTNNILVFDGIPVRKNGVAYIYDRVSERLYGNAGASGTSVTYGPDIPFDEYVQYIETDCVASYIDTGITPLLSTYSVSTKFQVLSVGNPTMTTLIGNNIFGAASNANPVGQRMSFVAQPANSVFRVMIPSNASAPYPAYDNNVHEVSYGNSGLVFDGVSYPVNTSTNTCGSMCLGTRGNIPATSNPQNYYTQTRFYYFKIYDGDTLVFDGIPVVDSNGVAGMYDRISTTLKYNAAATGIITPGPRI